LYSGVVVKYGSGVLPVSDPQRNYSIFSGWYLYGDNQEYDFSTPITKYTVLYAKWECEDGYNER
jgi:hypothetical protein